MGAGDTVLAPPPAYPIQPDDMPGWRVDFMRRNKHLVAALARIKSYLDDGTFTPTQVAAIAAVEGSQECLREIADLYRRRRDVLCNRSRQATRGIKETFRRESRAGVRSHPGFVERRDLRA